MKHLSDEDLVRQYLQTQQNRYFDVLYERYSDRVYRKCLSFSKDPMKAQDYTHDIFLRLVTKLNSFKEQAKFSTWLYSITYNFCTDQLRAERKMPSYSLDETYMNYAGGQDNDEAELAEMEARQLQQALTRMNAEERSLLLMKYQDEASIRDIATVYDVTESAVKMRLKRSREKLKKYYLESSLFWLLLAAKLLSNIRWPTH
jgi:RNA polymerase sigma factor (sigma-70 family)